MIDHATDRVRKAIILHPVKHHGADREHAFLTLAARFPIHGERNAALRLLVHPGDFAGRWWCPDAADFSGRRWRAGGTPSDRIVDRRRHRRTASQQRNQDKTT